MSAFILSDKHISTISRLMVTPDKVQDFANMLKRCNIASVNHRYNEKTRATKCKIVTMDDCMNVTMDDLIALIRCWSYQACEGNLIEYQILSDFLEYKLKRLGYAKDYEPNSNIWSI